jgi:Na+/proline symporter
MWIFGMGGVMAWLAKLSRNWGIKIIETICTTSIGHGILLWLASRDIHPDQWMASLMEEAANVQITNAIWWMIAGLFGLSCTILIEAIKSV